MTASLLAFAAVALVLVLTPGPDFAVVVPNALRGRGIATSLGTASGLAVHAAIAVAGLSSIILASDVAFSIVKYAGAAFLAYLGIRALWKSRNAQPSKQRIPASAPVPLTSRRAYQQGLLVNVLNPKAPLIYLSIMPQFLQPTQPATAQLLAMSAILVGCALSWYMILTLLVTRLRPVIERFGAWIDRATGVVLISLGIRVAFETRPV